MLAEFLSEQGEWAQVMTFLQRAVLVLERGLPCHKHGTVRRRSPRSEELIR